MAKRFRPASYNVENLFSRAKVLNFQNNETGAEWFEKVAALRAELKRITCNRIFKLYHGLKELIEASRKFTNGTTKSFPSVQKPADAASDHGAVWAHLEV